MIGKYFPILIFLPVLVFQIQCRFLEGTKGGSMDEGRVEDLLAPGNYDLNVEMESVPRKEYPFVKKYIRSPNPQVRDLVVLLLHHVRQPWVFPYLIELLHDTVSTIPGTAAEGIYLLNPKDKKDVLLQEVTRICTSHASDERRIIASRLILTLGNIGGKGDIEPLLALSINEKMPEIQLEFQKALAKFGYQKSIREIEFELTHANGFGKVDALRKVEYLKDPSWVPKIKPMLLDEEVGSTTEMGNITIRWNVCDRAVDVLRKIDPEKRIKFPEFWAAGYSADLIQQARQAYGPSHEVSVAC
jgi:hypothetical protein